MASAASSKLRPTNSGHVFGSDMIAVIFRDRLREKSEEMKQILDTLLLPWDF